MCGRFVISSAAESVAKWFGTRNATPNARSRYNAAPTQSILAVRYDPETAERRLDPLRWGLAPYWAEDMKIGYSLINAKAETIAEKTAFRNAFKSRRCGIAPDAFYEWKKLDSTTKATIRDRDDGARLVRVRRVVGAVERQGERRAGPLMHDHYHDT
jgi:putative SOS response-associated peptidase YedK